MAPLVHEGEGRGGVGCIDRLHLYRCIIVRSVNLLVPLLLQIFIGRRVPCLIMSRSFSLPLLSSFLLSSHILFFPVFISLPFALILLQPHSLSLYSFTTPPSSLPHSFGRSSCDLAKFMNTCSSVFWQTV